MPKQKTMVISECPDRRVGGDYRFNLYDTKVNHCVGCWSCWWTTPGRCVHKDLDEFYHGYVNADKAIFLAKVSRGFVSSNMKSLFDRMIPLFMPYISVKTGESMHYPRYEKYPDIEFYYDGEFATEDARKIYESYINRVFYQFHSQSIVVKPISQYAADGEVVK